MKKIILLLVVAILAACGVADDPDYVWFKTEIDLIDSICKELKPELGWRKGMRVYNVTEDELQMLFKSLKQTAKKDFNMSFKQYIMIMANM